MIRTPINKDIGKIRNKDIWILTWREAIYSGIAMLAGVGMCWLLYPHLGISTSAWISMIVVMPIAGMGFFSFNGLTLLDIAKELLFNRAPFVFGSNFETEKKEITKQIDNKKKRGKLWDYLIIKRRKN